MPLQRDVPLIDFAISEWQVEMPTKVVNNNIGCAISLFAYFEAEHNGEKNYGNRATIKNVMTI